MVALTASLVLLQPFGGWLADRFGDMRMLLAGLGVGGISLMAFSAQTNETLLLLTALLFSLGMALAWPAVSGVITEISANRQRGGIAGVWMMFTDLACLVGPVFGGAITLFSGTVSSVFFTMGAMLVVSVIPLALLKR
jgi:MFS family permease